MKKLLLKSSVFYFFACCILQFALPGCGFYKLTDTSPLPSNIKTVRIQTFQNVAPYQNTQLSPALTERLRQKIVSQTKLTDVRNSDAHYDISGKITDYSVSTTGVSTSTGTQQASINRLTVTVHVTLNKTLSGEVQEFDVTRNFDFDAKLSLQSAESTLLDEMVRNLTDEIFNRIFSNWD